MSGEIRIVTEHFDGYANRTRTTQGDLAGCTGLTELSFPDDPIVTSAFRNFLDRWDENREQLVDAIGVAADAFEEIARTFEAADAALAASISADGSTAATGAGGHGQ